MSKIKQRLDLIGYSIMEVKKRYEEYVESYPGDASNFYSFNDLYNEYINLITNGRYSRTNIARTTRH
ncbi:hypothetical protein [Lactobacillus helveticus]|uniref:hypothetical protein n=1 Tax=Lactobacillus helveticus TaxID=1587 RepID=UPI0018851919